jgi:V-type H+-transporting ATPase subunit a
VNPALFTIVTFPFLFGVMFGDILHGALLFIFSTILCFSERKQGTMMGALGPARYLLLLMGFFSLFCGFVYNDMTSIPLKLFGDSCYEMPVEHTPGVHSYMTVKPDCIYPIGIDPAWYLAKNELTFVNSLKMKMAVILGVAQMALGVCMKGLNNLYF